MKLFNNIYSKIELLSSEKKSFIGFFLILISTIFFSFSNVIVKQLTVKYSSFTVVFWRGGVGLIIILFLARFNIKKLLGVNRRGLLWRGIIGTITLASFFMAVKHATLSNSIGIFNTYPVFTVLVGSLFFKERWSKIYFFSFSSRKF